MKVLFVCLGNICRSPLAEGILRAKASAHGLTIEVDSAGTANYHVDEAPDKRSREVARKHGLSLDDLRGRQFSSNDFEVFDRIFVMDLSNKENVLSLASNGGHRKKVDLILNQAHPGEDMEVPDPYYGGDDGFEHVYQLLDKACDQFIQSVQSR